jgi:hypothetical protein
VRRWLTASYDIGHATLILPRLFRVATELQQ